MYPPVFATKTFSLQGYSLSHEERHVELMRDPTTRHFMDDEDETEEDVRNMFHKVFPIYEKSESTKWHWIWAIYKDSVFAGHLELKDTTHTTKEELEIVYAIHPEFRRIGLMTSVLFLLASKQEEWERKIIATVDPKNKVSLKVLENWGIDRIEIIQDDGEDCHKIHLRQIKH